MAAAINMSATPDRDDRLFPGDVRQFSAGGLNLAYGAAGVLYALDVAGAGRFPAHEEWLLEHAMRPQPDGRLGFYDGAHGIAYVLDLLEHPPGLKPGMSAEARIEQGARPKVLQAPVESVLRSGREAFCYVKVGKGLEERRVTTGDGGERRPIWQRGSKSRSPTAAALLLVDFSTRAPSLPR